jgi:hypothetical protein
MSASITTTRLATTKSIEVFDEDKQQACQAALLPADRPIPADEVNGLSLVISVAAD